MTITGSCLCGTSAFELDGPFGAFQYCHCSRCRKKSGSAHGANIFVPPGQFRWVCGEDVVRRFELPGARAFCSGFCSVCGSAMPWRTRSGQLVIVPAGALDTDPGERPQRNVHFASRAPWYVPSAELPTHDGEGR
jgi:hypothetical protein